MQAVVRLTGFPTENLPKSVELIIRTKAVVLQYMRMLLGDGMRQVLRDSFKCKLRLLKYSILKSMLPDLSASRID